MESQNNLVANETAKFPLADHGDNLADSTTQAHGSEPPDIQQGQGGVRTTVVGRITDMIDGDSPVAYLGLAGGVIGVIIGGLIWVMWQLI